MQNRQLAARHRYLQARRNHEIELLREEEKQKAAQKIIDMAHQVKSVATIIPTALATDLVCHQCNREFKAKAGLKSHLIANKCKGD